MNNRERRVNHNKILDKCKYVSTCELGIKKDHGFLNVHTAYYSAARVFQMEGWEFLLKVKDSHWNYQDRTVITKAIYNCI